MIPSLVLGLALSGSAAGPAPHACQAIAALAPPGTNPVLLPSYPTATDPALRQVAFTYDNALALIALLACHDRALAARIGAALVYAAGHDRYFPDGRLRNAYRAGPVPAAGPVALPGWWDGAAKRWDEDAYAIGSGTGNLAWAALALIWLAPNHPAPEAARLMRVVAGFAAPRGAGFTGGTVGEDRAQTRLAFQSTEQNTEAAVAFRRLGMAEAAESARDFVASRWQQGPGDFATGSGAGPVALDAQMLPLLGFRHAPAEWGRARAYVRAHLRAHLRAGAGYAFSTGSRQTAWTEGTALAALTLPDDAALAAIRANRAPDGLLYASFSGSVTTGFANAPGATPYTYPHLPHLGATAWEIFAATGTNPLRPPPP